MIKNVFSIIKWCNTIFIHSYSNVLALFSTSGAIIHREFRFAACDEPQFFVKIHDASLLQWKWKALRRNKSETIHALMGCGASTCCTASLAIVGVSPEKSTTRLIQLNELSHLGASQII